ncbi:CsbD family protein [Kitasatospora cineracea]|uniref:CsbD family protein n=1 Tax=Kitasatospora cineracea TaxID=88074 RepID=UPI0036C329E8
MSTGDKLHNTGDRLKGTVKETAGEAVGNERLEAESKADRAKGDLKQAGEHVKDAFNG